MKVFVLEDDPVRTAIFAEFFTTQELTLCNNSAQAEAILDHFRFDLVFLDHDLGGQTYVDSDEPNTGFAVARSLPQSLNAETPVVIHSANVNGAIRMSEVIGPHALRIPFSVLSLEQIVQRFCGS